MKHTLFIATVLLLGGTGAFAQSLSRSEILGYAPNADVAALTSLQIVELQQIMASRDKEGEVRSDVRNYLGLN